jgi:hypothetical protein
MMTLNDFCRFSADPQQHAGGDLTKQCVWSAVNRYRSGNFRRSQIVDFRRACAPAFVIAPNGIVTDRY